MQGHNKICKKVFHFLSEKRDDKICKKTQGWVYRPTNTQTGINGFTSHPKEGVVTDFSSQKILQFLSEKRDDTV